MAWNDARRKKASEAAKQRWEDKKKMEAPNIIASTTPVPPEVAAAEAAQAARENDPRNRVKPGQDTFDQFQEEAHRLGRDDDLKYGMPAPVADYEGVAARLPFDPATVGQMFGSDWDKSVVTPRMMKDYGINPQTEVPKWCLMENYGNRGVDYEQEHLNDNPYDRICTYVGPDETKRGRKYRRAGYTLCARPREVEDWIERRRREVSVNLTETAPKGNPELPHENSPEMQKLREETNRSIQQYLQDSPSARLGGENLEVALQRFSPEETQRIQDDALRMVNPTGFARLQAMTAENARDKTAEQLKAVAAGRGGTYSVNVAFDKDGKRIA